MGPWITLHRGPPSKNRQNLSKEPEPPHTIYLLVIGWTYSILTILGLFGDRGFQQSLSASRFERRVRHMGEAFYLICGCGETGGLLLRTLDGLGLRCVVLEIDEARISELELEDFRSDVPALVADAGQPQALLLGGLLHPRCRGVLALTNRDESNLAIAVAVRLLNDSIPVLCRAESPEMSARMKAFGADHVVNPFDTFGQLLGLAVHAPASFRLHEWLVGIPGTRQTVSQDPPAGSWVICGYGRFGRSVVSHLAREGMDIALIDPNPQAAPGFKVVEGSGVEEAALRAAGIMEAEGFVAGTDDDINNLSIAMAAKQINPKLFIVARQNQQARHALFEAFAAELTVVPSEIVAQSCLSLLITPLLSAFLNLAEKEGDDWAWALLSRMRMSLGDEVPESWTVSLDAARAAAVRSWLDRDAGALMLSTILTDPTNRDEHLACLPLLLRRQGADHLVPSADEYLQAGDEILFAGTKRARVSQDLVLQNANALNYVLTMDEGSTGWLWDWIRRHRP